MLSDTPFVNIWKFISQCQTLRSSGEELKGLLEEKTEEERKLSDAVIPDYYQQALDEFYSKIIDKYQCSFNEAFCKESRRFTSDLSSIETWLRLIFQDKRRK